TFGKGRAPAGQTLFDCQDGWVMSVHLTALSITVPPFSSNVGSWVPEVPAVNTVCRCNDGSRIFAVKAYALLACHSGAVNPGLESVFSKRAQETGVPSVTFVQI